MDLITPEMLQRPHQHTRCAVTPTYACPPLHLILHAAAAVAFKW